MAVRNAAYVSTEIWDDPDFAARSTDAQWLYLHLLTQPNLGFAGIIATTRGRWARKAHGMTVAKVTKASRELEAALFLVVDEETEDTLVRTFIRHDGIYKQPKLLRIAIREAMACTSRPIREAIGAELAACEMAELSEDPTRQRHDEPGKPTGPSIRHQVEAQITEVLPHLLGIAPYPTASLPPSLGPSAPPSVGASRGLSPGP